MSISKIMSKCVAECTEDASLEEVYQLIRKCKHGLVVVVDSEAHRVPIGVVNERSICEQLIVRGRNPRGLTAGSVMDSRIKTIRDSEAAISIAHDEAQSLTALVVTNERRQVCGIVPKEKISQIPGTVAATNSPGAIYVNMSVRHSPATSEIPAFGWIQ